MTVRLYKSTDASAPALSGSAGALLTVLDAVLVNGYGSQTAAGWTIAYTATNKRQYQMAAGGTGCQLYIDDTGPGAATTKEARINGFKAGSAIGVGTGQFPTNVQMVATSGTLVVRKSTTADATARAWTIIADGNTLYMFVESGDYTNPLMSHPWMFGDFFSYSSTDTNNCAIIGRTIENSSAFCVAGTLLPTSVYEGFSPFAVMNSTGLSNLVAGNYVAGNYTGLGGSIQVGKHTDLTKMGGSAGSATGLSVIAMCMGYQGYWSSGSNGSGGTWANQFVYPNLPDNGMYVAPVWIHHNGIVRGYFKGLWAPLQHVPLGHNDTYTGTGNVNGKSFIAQSILACSANNITFTPGQVHIEYSNTWT